MFGKLLVIIVALGAAACVLLVNRQQRLDIAHEMARAHRQTIRNERTIVDLRRQIARATTPAEIRAAKQEIQTEWESIPARQSVVIQGERPRP